MFFHNESSGRLLRVPCQGACLELLGSVAGLVSALHYEFLLFALAGLLIGGIDDFAFDVIFLARALWRRLFVYSRHERMTGASLPPSRKPGTTAVFIPAWHEAEVIGAMLRICLARWAGADFRIFVGTYPNDPATILAVAKVAEQDTRVQLVILPHEGGTTKADCLNHVWAAMLRAEVAEGRRFKAVVLHDAEDVVHADEIRLFDVMIDRFDMVQLPVLPLIAPHSRWIAGHYADEFAEAHGKHLIMREAMGAAVPSAGVGCAFARDMIGAIAEERAGAPFDAASLAEDYEIGLRIAERKGRTVFVSMRDATGALICTQEHFPDTLEAAIKQKARWLTGISLAGWDRLGWSGTWRGWAVRPLRLDSCSMRRGFARPWMTKHVISVQRAYCAWRSPWMGARRSRSGRCKRLRVTFELRCCRFRSSRLTFDCGTKQRCAASMMMRGLRRESTKWCSSIATGS